MLNGKEVEFEATEEELWAGYRKQRAADERFEAAAKLRKEAAALQQQQQALVQQLKADPRAVLNFLREQGVENPLDYVATALQAEIAEEERLADPNVRARVEAERRLAKLEEERELQTQQQQQAQLQADVEAEMERISAVFTEAIEQLPDLPRDDDTLSIMAALEATNRHRGLKITPAQLAQETRDRIIGRGVGALKKLPPERLLQVDPELTKAFRKALVAEWKKGQNQPPAPAPQPGASSAPVPEKRGYRIMSDKEEAEQLWPGKRVLPGI